MSNKVERIAINLTKLAQDIESRDYTSVLPDEYYEIAKDAGVVVIAGCKYGYNHWVFIPKKEWEEVDAVVNAHAEIGNDARWRWHNIVWRYAHRAGLSCIDGLPKDFKERVKYFDGLKG